MDLHTHEADQYGTFDRYLFVRKAIQFEVLVGLADEAFALVVAAFPGGFVLEERFAGWDHTAVVGEARGLVAEIISPQDRPVYGSPEWEVEVEAEMLRAEEACYGR